jgi:hypothetical protein
MIKFETILLKEKVVKMEKLAERLGQRREGVITMNNKIKKAATWEIIVVKG